MNLILLTELSILVCHQKDVFSHETLDLWTTFSSLAYSVHHINTKHLKILYTDINVLTIILIFLKLTKFSYQLPAFFAGLGLSNQ